MSMLSAQCDELRAWARQFRARQKDFGALSIALANDLDRAADTIWELRCKLNGTYYWTADEVRELFHRHVTAKPTFDFGNIGAVYAADYDAIADELNHAEPRNRETMPDELPDSGDYVGIADALNHREPRNRETTA